MKKIAALDLGSNSFLLTIAEIEDFEIKKVLLDTFEIVQLGQSINALQKIDEPTLRRVEEAFKKFKKWILEYGVDEVRAVSTSAARDAKNKDEFIKLGEKYNISIKIISGEEEACLSYLGAMFDQSKEAPLTLLDIGGGSTEFNFENKAKNKKSLKSINIGSVRLKEKFISKYPVLENEKQNLKNHIKEQLLGQIRHEAFSKDILAVAGTPTTLACIFQKIDFKEEKVHGYKISFHQLSDFLKKIETMSINEIEKIKGLEKKRAPVIYIGATILYEVMKHFDVNEVKVSTKGLRYGLLIGFERL